MEIGPYLGSCGRYIERNPVRAGLAVTAWEYKWSSAAAYVKKAVDGVTDENPYMGEFKDSDRVVYGERLMSGVDEKIVKEVEGERAIGGKEFAATLKMERGRYRVKRGRPAKSV